MMEFKDKSALFRFLRNNSAEFDGIKPTESPVQGTERK